MKRMVGSRIFDDYYPDRYYNHDAEWTEGLIKIGETKQKEPLVLNRRCLSPQLSLPAAGSGLATADLEPH